MLTAHEVRARLEGRPKGTRVFVSYVAGRAPTERALRESESSSDAGENRRHFVGSLESLWQAKNGDTIVTVQAFNRDTESPDGLKPGGFRSFNPNLGKLLALDVLDGSL